MNLFSWALLTTGVAVFIMASTTKPKKPFPAPGPDPVPPKPSSTYPGCRRVMSVPTEVASRALQLLGEMEIGETRREGKWLYVCEVHAPNVGHPYDHKGISVLDCS